MRAMRMCASAARTVGTGSGGGGRSSGARGRYCAGQRSGAAAAQRSACARERGARAGAQTQRSAAPCSAGGRGGRLAEGARPSSTRAQSGSGPGATSLRCAGGRWEGAVAAIMVRAARTVGANSRAGTPHATTTSTNACGSSASVRTRAGSTTAMTRLSHSSSILSLSQFAPSITLTLTTTKRLKCNDSSGRFKRDGRTSLFLLSLF